MAEALAFPDRLSLIDGGMSGASRIFIVENSFRFLSSKGTITVPAGFATDGASIPRIFWNIFEPFGAYFHAALIHDFCYSNLDKAFTRREADDLLNEGMRALGVNWFTRQAVYRSVRLFGWRFFKGAA